MKYLVVFIGLYFIIFYNCFLQAQWVQTNGPSGGAIYCFALCENNILVGAHGRVFLSTNNGTEWILKNSGLTNSVVYTLAVDGANIFAGTQDGVFLSTNNGTSWTQTGLANNYVSSLGISGTNIIAGTLGNGIYLSTDYGLSWTQVNSGLPANTTVNALKISGHK